MIPKRIHLIWIGPNQPPWSCIETWRTDLVAACPEWDVWLWRDRDIEQLELRNRDAYESTSSLCGKADIARYEIIYRYGGIYIDADSVERLVATSWHGLAAADVPALVARYRREGEAISLQLGYTTNGLWKSKIDIGASKD